ncbi:MAG: helix-turn-helix transcriptional regulator, partial [Aeromonas sobria]
GSVYHWPSITAACSDGGFCYNMIKLCLAGQLESYSGMKFESDTPRRSVAPSARIIECAELYKKGLTGQQMADTMGISLDTVKFHKQRAKALGLIQLRKMSK